MRIALFSSACALGIMSVAYVGCSKTHDRASQSPSSQPSAAEQRRIEEKRAEERRAEDRRWEEQRAEERRADEKRLAEERRLADDRRVAEERRLSDERRLSEERRLADERRARSIGGGPSEPALRATTTSAVSNIAAARCDREARCNNIGAKEKYRTRAACVADLRRDKREDLNSDACPGGVREKDLAECLQTIRDEDCGNPLDTISRLSACRTGNLCVK